MMQNSKLWDILQISQKLFVSENKAVTNFGINVKQEQKPGA